MEPLSGVLFFPATPFDAGGNVDEQVLATHLDMGLRAGPGAVFAACGTGEFHALDAAEHEAVVRTAVTQAAGRVPVFAGVGGSVKGATAMARAAKDAGADGLLMLPPYLVQAPQRGLYAYAAAVAGATDLPLIAYHRGNSVFEPETAARIAQLPTVIGIKDGLGDLELLTHIMAAVHPGTAGNGKPFQFFNGLPTAELTMPAYRGVGVNLYSSAVFAFAPEIALAFHHALISDDRDRVDELLRGFFVPLTRLRAHVPGYAVSLVKAGIRLRGIDVGGVRPPLVDPTPDDHSELERIIAQGLALVQQAIAS